MQLTDALQRRGVKYATHHAGRVPLVVSARVARQWGLWDPANEARLEAVESRNYTWQLVTWAFDLVLAALSVYALIMLRRRHKLIEAAPFVLLLGAVTLDAALVYGKQRFQAAAQPALLVLAAYALVLLARRARRERAPADPAA
jgi:hypothetical protein